MQCWKNPSIGEPVSEISDLVHDFNDVEQFLAEYQLDEALEEEVYEEAEVAEALAISWKDRRQELSRLQKARNFSSNAAKSNELRRSFRVEVEELKKKTRCHRCGQLGHVQGMSKRKRQRQAVLFLEGLLRDWCSPGTTRPRRCLQVGRRLTSCVPRSEQQILDS